MKVSFQLNAAVVMLGFFAAPAFAQNAAVSPTAAPTASTDKYTLDELAAMESSLTQKADASGLAAEPLRKYGSDYTLLVFRNQSGKAELHQKFADFYIVLEGNATIVSGGHMVNPATTAPGEERGDSVQDGKETKVSKGDIVHIPANIPHQLMLAKGATLRYFVIKVQEVD